VLSPRGEFRLATLVPSPYTHLFHADGHATVAQWQSTGFVNQMLWVQLPPVASREGYTGFRASGGVSEHYSNCLLGRALATPGSRGAFALLLGFTAG
jgi:hypothetical protein